MLHLNQTLALEEKLVVVIVVAVVVVSLPESPVGQNH